jgi:hypothetical protein
MTQQFHSKPCTQKKWKQGLRYLCTNVHSRITHSSQEVVTTHVPISRRMDKQNVAYTQNKILFNHIKEWSSDTSYNREEPWKHYTEWKKPVTEDLMLSVRNMICQNRHFLYRERTLAVALRQRNGEGWGVEWELTANGYWISLWSNGNILKLAMVMVAQPCEHTKNHWTVHFKWLDFIACELYLYKVIFKNPAGPWHMDPFLLPMMSQDKLPPILVPTAASYLFGMGETISSYHQSSLSAHHTKILTRTRSCLYK